MTDYTQHASWEQVIEGKTKILYKLPNDATKVYVKSKDDITAGDGARKDVIEGKAILANNTACCCMGLLKKAGVPISFIEKVADDAFVALNCDMIPIECVTRRLATGSYLRRHKTPFPIEEGVRFSPPLCEWFYKDDANHDPQVTREQVLAAKLKAGGVEVDENIFEEMAVMQLLIFEILERAWAAHDCSLVDMKVEFGITSEGKLVLSDVVDNDAWRLWPSGDPRLMKDKQVYRNLADDGRSEEALAVVKRSYEWVAAEALKLENRPSSRVVIFMGSPSDMEYCQKIQKTLTKLHVASETIICSAHKATETCKKILSKLESQDIPTVIIAVAGRSNGLGPVLSGNATCPVINCPPPSTQWADKDVWSSLRLPSGLGCTTALDADTAGLMSAQIFALSDPVIWSALRAKKFQMWQSLHHANTSQ